MRGFYEKRPKSFRYDAAGNRVLKIANNDTTVYVRDASGNVMGVYKNDTLVEQSIYGSSRLGLMTWAFPSMHIFYRKS